MTVGTKVLHPELSYRITGACFHVHNTLGRFAREKQYCDALEQALSDAGISFVREYAVPWSGNRVDFLIEGLVVLEAKAKDVLTKEDYEQIQRYLQCFGVKLGLLVNFHSRYLKPTRIIKIETNVAKKFA